MSITGHTRDTWESIKQHRELVAKKHARIDGLRALIATHESGPILDPKYLRDLKAKLNTVIKELKTMDVTWEATKIE
jgi:hypothetical protein